MHFSWTGSDLTPWTIFLAGHHLGPVESDGSELDAEGTGSFQEGIDLGGAQQRLGGHAGAERAVTPWLVHLDHGHGVSVRAQPLGGCGSRRTAAEDKGVKLAVGFRRSTHTPSLVAVHRRRCRFGRGGLSQLHGHATRLLKSLGPE
jgi:hypothetical protein